MRDCYKNPKISKVWRVDNFRAFLFSKINLHTDPPEIIQNKNMVLAWSIDFTAALSIRKATSSRNVPLGRSRDAARPEDRAACSSSSSRTNLRLLEIPRIARRAAKVVAGIAGASWCRTSSWWDAVATQTSNSRCKQKPRLLKTQINNLLRHKYLSLFEYKIISTKFGCHPWNCSGSKF